ncbi:hypothetical protein Dxin01_02768 [Deinococcus xinjiangensis]|uniref:Uncharacterized protein n=1 Tax=Deinococcus xinjiangensis TaxID=457454 RepID=A0ABP9VCQ2_9DEIO
MLLAFGRRGASRPLLLLYDAAVESTHVAAPAYSVLYPVTARSEMLVEMVQHKNRTWGAKRGGLRVSLPKQSQGHHLHDSITLKRRHLK